MSKIAFFGTPHFAAQFLEPLMIFCKQYDHELAFVVSQPDRPKGRGNRVAETPVKIAANSLGIPVYQPSTLKKQTTAGDEFYNFLVAQKVDLAIVVAYGRILSPRVLRAVRLGFLNVHGSLLPRWRGAAPIQRALMAGDLETGITLMDLVFELDAGDIYAMSALPIEEHDDASSLFDRLGSLGKDFLIERLPNILAGTAIKTPQPQQGITLASMIVKSEGLIDWNQDSTTIVNTARGICLWPGSHTILNGKRLKLFGAKTAQQTTARAPGTIVSTHDNLIVATANGSVSFNAVQPEGKRKMAIRDFISGHALKTDELLG